MEAETGAVEAEAIGVEVEVVDEIAASTSLLRTSTLETSRFTAKAFEDSDDESAFLFAMI